MYLFEDYPVTENDIERWLDSIPNLSKSPFRRQAYRKAYRIEDKIRSAKKDGTWPILKAEKETE